MRLAASALVLLALLAPACGGDGEDEAAPDEPPATAPAPAPTAEEEQGDETGGAIGWDDPEVVATGLEAPWEVVPVPGGDLLLTERPGRVRLVQDGELRAEPVAELDVAGRGEGGLLGLAIHPDWERERFAYAYFTAPDGNRVSRYPVGEDFSFGEEEVLVEGIPAGSIHNGGRIAFGPDGLLYVGTGDAGQPELAADPSSLGGKVLRVTPEGAPAEDNPFGETPVYAYGLRNVQGLAWDDEGRLFASSHGPSGEFGLCCLDELNLIEAGAFYGWPQRAATVDAAGGEPPAEPVDPIADSGTDDTWAPSGIAWVPGEGGRGEVLMANLRGEALLRFVLADGGTAVEATEVAVDGLGRLRAVRAADDGCVLVLTANRDGRGSPRDDDDRVLRFCPS